MNTISEIEEELKQISNLLAKLPKQQPFTLPNTYFDTLADTILNKIRGEELGFGAKENIYTTPNGYFSELPQKILFKIKEQKTGSNEIFEELENVAPTLNKISKNNIYYLPNNYFETLSITTSQQKTAKIVTFNKTKRWLNYAAAAVITGVVAVGGIKLLGKKNVVDIKIEMAKSSDDEINQYLENEPGIDYAFTSVTGTDDQETNSLFEGMTEEEIKQYLKEQPETVEKSKKEI